jgi:4-amino-4-deoxy-L-arabinose transferase-like glycosyltransferase
MLKLLNKYPILSISLIVCAMLLPYLDVPYITIMEARNFISAREMAIDSNWLLTTLNGEPRYEKPPLPTWLSAISGLIFGLKSVYALRLPGVILVLTIGIFCYLLSLRLNLTKKQSVYNALIAVTSFYVIGILNEAPWDIFAHGFMLVGIYYLFMLFIQPKIQFKYAILSGIFIGFSIMSKGPVSLYALLLPFLISFGINYKFNWDSKKIIALFCSILLMIIVGGWWYLYVRVFDSETFLQIASRETGNWSSYNVKPFYYYWNFFVQSGIWTIPTIISLIYPYIIKRIENKKAYKFTFWWTIIAVVLLSLIPEKKARYLMPVLIPLALNTGFYINYLVNEFKNLKSKKELFVVNFNFGLIAFFAFALPIALVLLLKKGIYNYILNYILLTAALWVIGFLIVKNLIKKQFEHIFILTLFFMVTILGLGLPISKTINKNSSYNSIQNLNQIEKKLNINSYSFKEVAPEILWYYNGKIADLNKNGNLTLPKESNFGLLLKSEDTATVLKQFNNQYNFEFLETYNANTGSKLKERLIGHYYKVSKK